MKWAVRGSAAGEMTDLVVFRQKKYKSKRALSEAVERYFGSISRTVNAAERYDTGDKDEKGQAIFEERPILNDYGEVIRYKEYIIPPTVGGLCEYLGINMSEWSRYCNDPDFADITGRTLERMSTWSEQQLLTRKDVKGIIFSLQNNYGYTDKREVEFGPKAAKTIGRIAMSTSQKGALLRELQREAMAEQAGREAAPDERDDEEDADGAGA